MAAPRNSPFRDKFGRYVGPMKTKTSFPPSPYGAAGEHCLGCGMHWLDPHALGCAYRGPWDR